MLNLVIVTHWPCSWWVSQRQRTRFSKSLTGWAVSSHCHSFIFIQKKWWTGCTIMSKASSALQATLHLAFCLSHTPHIQTSGCGRMAARCTNSLNTGFVFSIVTSVQLSKSRCPQGVIYLKGCSVSDSLLERYCHTLQVLQ